MSQERWIARENDSGRRRRRPARKNSQSESVSSVVLRFDRDEFLCLDFYDLLIFAAAYEFHNAIGECKECVVFAHPHIRARIELRTTLAQNDIAGDDSFSAELFHAQSLAVRIAAVARRTEPLLMRKTLQINDETQRK